MSKIDVNQLEEGNLKIEVVDSPEGVRMKIAGSIEMQNPRSIISPYFDDVHNKILSSKIKLIEIDITELQFMNSSGIGTFIKWFVKIPPLTDEEKYQVKIIYNRNISWHTKGLAPLLSLAKGQIDLVESKG